MTCYKLKIDKSLNFSSIHTLDYNRWKPRLKLLADFDLIYSAHSTVYMKYDSKDIILKPGEGFLASPGHTMQISSQTTPKTGVWVLHFSCVTYTQHSLIDILDEGLTNYDILNDSEPYMIISGRFKVNGDILCSILSTISEEIKFKRYGYENKLNICLLDLLYELHRCSMEDIIHGNAEYNYHTVNGYVRKTIEFLHSNYTKALRLIDIEEYLNLNYDYANTLFKSITGYTIMNYLDHIRMNRVKELLDTTALSIGDISQLTGISDPHYLSKKFKKKEGVSPSQYRKQL